MPRLSRFEPGTGLMNQICLHSDFIMYIKRLFLNPATSVPFDGRMSCGGLQLWAYLTLQ